MPEQVYIGNFAKGLKLDRLPFNIDNDAFPTMFNFYSWRGRAKRKRGTVFLGRLEIQIQSVLNATPPTNYQVGQIMTLDGSGDGSANLISLFSLGSTASIVPGSINLTDGTNTYTEPAIPDGTLVGIPAGVGTINYTTGALTITGGAAAGVVRGIAISGPNEQSFSYFPGDPVMGLRDFVFTPYGSSASSNPLYPLLLAFDTTNAYQINQSNSPVNFYNVTYYKGTNTPFVWSGMDYQQFWTTNYSGALWATNNKPGFHFVKGTYSSGSGTANITFNFKSGVSNYTQLVIGDKLWFNEWSAGGVTINGLTGTVSDISGAASGNYVVTFSGNQTVSSTGIAELLTASISGQDGIKWYDGDPTSGTGIPTGTGLGWVNFAPPLTALTTTIENLPAAKYYLVGALAIVPFKGRLLFFSPWIQASGGSPIQLIDVVIWSWNGTPYYAAPVPTNETFDQTAYYIDQTGKGGYLSAGISQPITTVSNNEDVLLIGFGGRGRKTRFVFTGDDFNPFLFFNINSELPSDATFSAITLDKGAIDIGIYGIAMTDQQSSQRIDLDIPDSVFQIQALQNGVQRVNAVRDFFKEWIYFTYPINTVSYGDGSICRFPLNSFLFNYRDYTWSILYENFTAQGTYRPQKKKSWLSTGFSSWNTWREAWNSGAGSPQFPSIVGGNPQGYVLIKGQGTGEAPSGAIQTIANSGGNTQITSPNHCVSASNPGTGTGDYLLFQGILGATALNGQIGRVISTADANTFVVDLPFPAATYLGLGTFTRLSQPVIQTKQFNPYWQQGSQARLSVQKYLMDFTVNSQVTVNIYLSQDPDDSWNSPLSNPPPNSLIYSQILFTCPESTNIGLTPANTNLQMPTAEGQYQIWHRFNTSLIGDSFQIGMTLSDAQMKNLTYATTEITLHGMHLTFDRAGHLA